MKEANVKFEYDGYDVLADGEVYSPADVRELELTFVGCNMKDVDTNTIRAAKEEAMYLLVQKVYENELEF